MGQVASDEGYLIHDRGLQMIRGICRELLNTSDMRERIEIEKHAMQCESARRRKSVIEVASWIPELNLKTDDLDGDPWLLYFQNRTIDLRTGEIREQRLDPVHPDRRRVGYHRDTSKQSMFILFGTGANQYDYEHYWGLRDCNAWYYISYASCIACI